VEVALAFQGTEMLVDSGGIELEARADLPDRRGKAMLPSIGSHELQYLFLALGQALHQTYVGINPPAASSARPVFTPDPERETIAPALPSQERFQP
jgi:hypothetical protein